jgi:hypothetical protein
MPLTAENLKAVLEKGDAEACLALCIKAGEAERKAVASLASDWITRQAKNLFIETSPGSFNSNPLLPAAEVAALACCSLSQLKKLGWKGIPDADKAYAILATRRPGWIDDWVASICLETPHRWDLAHRLVRAGLCRRPDSDNYILGLVARGFAQWKDSRIRTALEADPVLLKHEVWRLFEVEGSGEFSLAAYDKYCRPDYNWATALKELAADGKLSRSRLLDASLDALERDFAQFRAGWYSRFHESLTPTLEERSARAGRYLGLLASRIPPTVSFALKALQILDKAGRLTGKALVDHIQPVFAARQQGTVKTALGFLDRAASREPALKARIAAAASEALAQEAPEVQGAALNLIEKHGNARDKKLAALVQARLSGLAASQRPRLLAWLGSSAKGDAGVDKTISADVKTLLKRAANCDRTWAKLTRLDAAVEAVRTQTGLAPPVEFEGIEIPRLHPDHAIQPIENLDELIDLLATVIEDAASPDAVERVLDGVSRLCGERPADFVARTAPLSKRAQVLLNRSTLEPFAGGGPALDLCGVALAWIGDVLPKAPKEKSVSGFLSARALAVAGRAHHQQPAPLLAAPTHAGGWLDPFILVERVEAWKELKNTPDIHDQVQALLRLATGHRAAALRKAGKLAGEYGNAVRYALGGRTPSIGPTAALWVAAARARDPFGDSLEVESRHPGFGPDAGAAARYSFRIKSREQRGNYHTASGPKQYHYTFHDFILDREPALPKKVALDLPTVLLHSTFFSWNANQIRWVAMVWPVARESLFAAGAFRLAENLDWWEANWANRTFLEPLLDPDVPMKPMALLVLTLGLAAKEAGESGLATDALIQAIADGRVGGEELGRIMASLLPTGMIKAARWAKTLAEAARMSPLHGHVVACAIEVGLQFEPARAPRDLATLLELLHELLLANGQALALDQTRDFLGKLPTAGKTAKLSAQLLALEPKSASTSLAAACQSLASRLDRIDRWAACEIHDLNSVITGVHHSIASNLSSGAVTSCSTR